MVANRPNDRRGFLHKKLLGLGRKALRLTPVGSVIETGLGVVSSLRGGGGGAARLPVTNFPVRRPADRSLTARPSEFSAAGKAAGRELKFGGGAPQLLGAAPSAPCIFPFRRDPRTGECRIFLGDQTGIDDTRIPDRGNGTPAITGDSGMAVEGRHGPGMIPGNMVVDRAICSRGMILGNDGVCYQKGAITNRERMWPKGRRPLVTGGDMRAISIANRVGTRLDKTKSRLRGMGFMKPLPRPRKATPKAGPRAPAGTTIVQN